MVDHASGELMGLESPHIDAIEVEYAYYQQAKTDAALVVCGHIDDPDLRLEILQMLGLIPNKEKEE